MDAAAGDAHSADTAARPEAQGRWWSAGGPIAVLVLVTCGVLVWPGLAGREEGVPVRLSQLFADADAYGSILYGAVSSAVVAVALTGIARAGSLKFAVDAMMTGMGRMLPAVSVLVLAWALSAASQELHVGDVVRQHLVDSAFSITWLPLAVFVSAAAVSFATGTSWGTMGILCPVVVVVAVGLAEDLPAGEALSLFYASVGSVLAGAIFGDHCSPISDTTVLSSIASGCSLELHVWTQLPYALIAAGAEIVLGDVVCSRFGLSPWIGLGLGAVALFAFLRLAGRRVVSDRAGP